MSDLIFSIVVVCQLVLMQTSHALWFNIPASGFKCVSEEIDNNVVVVADYRVISNDHTIETRAVSLKVTSPYGNIIHSKENVTYGQFAFTTNEIGSHEACFTVASSHEYKGDGISVYIDWKIGIATKDWDSIAKKEKLEGLELELKKLEDAVGGIHKNLLYLKKREANMRTNSEKTNSRVAWFSITSLMICIGVSTLQVWHLKTYFLKKRLI